MFDGILENVRAQKPITHNITNHVTANDCANITLACGAKPIMADSPLESAEITANCHALCLSLGTPNADKAEAMLKSGKKANELGHPVVFDPVGVGASEFRRNFAAKLAENVHFTVVRGNISEIKTLATGIPRAGVDVSDEDICTDNTDDIIAFAKDFARKSGCVIAVSGKTDIVTDGKTAFCIYNGDETMQYVTGAGCMLTSLIGAFLAANPDDAMGATAAAVCAMGLSGEIAAQRMGKADGSASYRDYIIDAIFNMTAEQLLEGANYEIK